MNWLDILILVPLVIDTVVGGWVGLIRAVISLAGLIAGLLLAGHFYGPLGDRLTFVSDQGAARMLAFAIIFLVVMLLAALIAWLLTRAASALTLGWVNRLGGAFFGLLMGAAFWGIVLAVWIEVIGSSDVISGSVMARILVDYIPIGSWLLPGQFSTGL